MPNFISEDAIEEAMVQRLQHVYGYDTLNCYTTDPADLNDGSGRNDKRDVILHDLLKEAAVALNPGIPVVGSRVGGAGHLCGRAYLHPRPWADSSAQPVEYHPPVGKAWTRTPRRFAGSSPRSKGSRATANMTSTAVAWRNGRAWSMP